MGVLNCNLAGFRWEALAQELPHLEARVCHSVLSTPRHFQGRQLRAAGAKVQGDGPVNCSMSTPHSSQQGSSNFCVASEAKRARNRRKRCRCVRGKHARALRWEQPWCILVAARRRVLWGCCEGMEQVKSKRNGGPIVHSRTGSGRDLGFYSQWDRKTVKGSQRRGHVI